MKEPCVVLDGIQGSGEFLRFCPQEDLIYWREPWLTPLPGGPGPQTPQASHRERPVA
jgi:hypothetical protein